MAGGWRVWEQHQQASLSNRRGTGTDKLLVVVTTSHEVTPNTEQNTITRDC